MKNYRRINRTIDNLYLKAIRRNDRAYNNMNNFICKFFNHIRQYWMVYWFLITKIFAIAMIGMGINCIVDHLNRELPFGIVLESGALWFIWSYAGSLIGVCIAAYGIMILFKNTINRWFSKL